MGQRGEIFGDLLLKPTQDVGHDMGEIIGEKVGDGRVRGGGELLAPRPLSSFDTLSNINLPSAVSMRRDESNQVKNIGKHETTLANNVPQQPTFKNLIRELS